MTLAGKPAHTEAATLVDSLLGPAAERHLGGDLRARDFPRVAETQPLVGDLDLPAVADRLIEDAELVADAVPDGGHIQRGQRVHVAGGQPSEPAISEAWFLFLVEEVSQAPGRVPPGPPPPRRGCPGRAGCCQDAGR